MAPPDMMGKEFDEDEMMKEEMEGQKHLFAHKYDHKDDKTPFEITLVNKENHALSIDCSVCHGKIYFNKARVYTDKGIQ